MKDEVFQNQDKINVVYFGGSITQQFCASKHSKCYAALSCEWLKNQFGSDRVNYINKAVGGTTSIYGLLRLGRDVIASKPDLLFVEFAVNDTGFDSSLYVESILRSLKKLDKIPYVVFLYTTNSTYTTPSETFEKIAEYYGIPQISLRDALKEHLDGKDAKECGYLADEVHPLDSGHKVYADTITGCLSKSEYYKKPLLDKMPLNPSAFELDMRFIPSTMAKAIGSWEYGVIRGLDVGDKEYSITTKKGDTLEIEFTGNVVAVEHSINKNGGKYDIYLDDELVAQKSTYYGGIDGNQLAMEYYNFDLEYGNHTIKIVTIQEDKQIMIFHFIVGNKS